MGGVGGNCTAAPRPPLTRPCKRVGIYPLTMPYTDLAVHSVIILLTIVLEVEIHSDIHTGGSLMSSLSASSTIVM